jgi:hypothetical protein
MAESNLACKAALDYLECVEARDAKGMRALFADVIEYYGPDGVFRSDPAEVEALLLAGWETPNPQYPTKNKLANLLPFGERGCLMEFGWLNEETGGVIFAAVDRFEVNDAGKITFFLPYFATSQLGKILPQIEYLKNKLAAAKAKNG